MKLIKLSVILFCFSASTLAVDESANVTLDSIKNKQLCVKESVVELRACNKKEVEDVSACTATALENKKQCIDGDVVECSTVCNGALTTEINQCISAYEGDTSSCGGDILCLLAASNTSTQCQAEANNVHAICLLSCP